MSDKLPIYIGIDYSMTSPAVCVHTGKDWSIDNCIFHYRYSKVNLSQTSDFSKYVASKIPEYKSEQERFYNNAVWCVSNIPKDSKGVLIEGYAYGSRTGIVFEMAEHTGLMKYLLWKDSIPFNVSPPSEIKKFATSKGNADKLLMEEAFKNETGISNIREILGQSVKSVNPSSDIIDSYYICKLNFFKSLRTP